MNRHRKEEALENIRIEILSLKYSVDDVNDALKELVKLKKKEVYGLDYYDPED
jgi:hypothetical protein